MRRKHFTAAVKREIVRKYHDGASVVELSNQYQVGKSTIYNWASCDILLSQPRCGLVSLPSMTKTNIINYMLSGHSVIDASKKYQVSRDEVKRIIDEYRDSDNAVTVAPPEKVFPVVTTESEVDKLCRMIELLVTNDIDVKAAIKVAKQLV